MTTELIYSHQYGTVKLRVSPSGDIKSAYSKDLKRILDPIETHLLEAELTGGTDYEF